MQVLTIPVMAIPSEDKPVLGLLWLPKAGVNLLFIPTYETLLRNTGRCWAPRPLLWPVICLLSLSCKRDGQARWAGLLPAPAAHTIALRAELAGSRQVFRAA